MGVCAVSPLCPSLSLSLSRYAQANVCMNVYLSTMYMYFECPPWCIQVYKETSIDQGAHTSARSSVDDQRSSIASSVEDLV